MSAGCVPDKEEREAILVHSKQLLQDALSVLSNINHPDECPRELEKAGGFIAEVLGRWHTEDLEYSKGLSDLIEHYFS